MLPVAGAGPPPARGRRFATAGSCAVAEDDGRGHPKALASAAPAFLRDRLKAQKAAINEALLDPGRPTRSVGAVLRRLARHVDAVLLALWRDAQLPRSIALLAVGGYGRGELFPHSDVDVRVLLPEGADPEQDPALRQRLEAFIGRCWDSGLEIGSSVRTVQECLDVAAADVTVQTSLLEARRLAGDRALFELFRRRFADALDPRAFFVAKTLEMRQRHNRFENTPYALEPNCKESPGGLRDLQVILWVAKA